MVLDLIQTSRINYPFLNFENIRILVLFYNHSFNLLFNFYFNIYIYLSQNTCV